MGAPSIYPTGTTIYDPEKCFNGFTLYDLDKVGTILVDMNGATMKVWDKLRGFPPKLLPNGDILGELGDRDPSIAYQDNTDVTQVA